MLWWYLQKARQVQVTELIWVPKETLMPYEVRHRHVSNNKDGVILSVSQGKVQGTWQELKKKNPKQWIEINKKISPWKTMHLISNKLPLPSRKTWSFSSKKKKKSKFINSLLVQPPNQEIILSTTKENGKGSHPTLKLSPATIVNRMFCYQVFQKESHSRSFFPFFLPCDRTKEIFWLVG